MPNHAFRLLSFASSLLLAGGAALADEGMWTFDNFPRALVRERYGVEIDDAWLERVRRGTVRLSGCTASFVSPDGLILTNHHCVASCLAQNSTRESSLLETGFVARSRESELDCPTQIADVLERLENVTAKVQDATRGLDERDANERRRQTLTELELACEKASTDASNPLKCEAVTLYGGGQYWLYKYRRYDDVRLVFAPEADIAAFGGDPDNFQFPRWCLDFSLLRAYENGRPATTPQHLTIDFDGPEAGEPVFVAGHPGSTDRLLTVAELKTLRDQHACRLRCCARPSCAAVTFSSRRPERKRAASCRTRCSASRTASRCSASSSTRCSTTRCWRKKSAAEADLRARVSRNRELAAEIGDPWQRIEQALAVEATRRLLYGYLEGGTGFNSRLARYARTLVRAAAERPKPNADRLREYTDGFLPRLEQQLGAPVPIYPELERLTLSFSLERMREWLGPDAPIVQRLLDGRDARRARGAARRRLAPRRSRGPHGALERRASRHRRLDGSVHRARALARRRSARAAQMARGQRRSRRRSGARADRARPLRRRSARASTPTRRSRCG